MRSLETGPHVRTDCRDPKNVDQAYDKVATKLSTLIHSKRRADGPTWAAAAANMHKYLEILDLQPQVIDGLQIVHVAGTKGKGSTCAMVESILRCCGYRTGLFTSPHLCDIRERIRINGKKVDKSTFIKAFWDCYRKVTGCVDLTEPGFFRFMTLLALKIFVEQSVDVTILEVGLGGRLDSTNVVQHPIVCGVTSLGYDHMDLLGDTLYEIATEKAGILKQGTPAFTVPQEEEAMRALKERAEMLGVKLSVVTPSSTFKIDDPFAGEYRLKGSYQMVNAALAVSLAAQWESRISGQQGNEGAEARREALEHGNIPREYSRGLDTFQWPGRAQIIPDDRTVPEVGSAVAGPHNSKLTFYLDGAHTPESLSACAEWFASEVKRADGVQLANGTRAKEASAVENMLLFNCLNDRNSSTLLGSLYHKLRGEGVHIDGAVFAPMESSKTALKPSAARPVDLSWQHEQCAAWRALRSKTGNEPCFGATREVLDSSLAAGHVGRDARNGMVMPTLRSSIDWMRSAAKTCPGTRFRVLVTGSLYLVGDVLRLLGRAPE